MVAEYVDMISDLIIDDALRLKRSAELMSVNIQELENEKDSTVADLKKEVVDLHQKNIIITDMLERVKTEKAASGADSKMVLYLSRRLYEHD